MSTTEPETAPLDPDVPDEDDDDEPETETA